MKRIAQRMALPTPEGSQKVRNFALSVAGVSGIVGAIATGPVGAIALTIAAIATVIAGKKQADIPIDQMIPAEFIKLRNKLQRQKEVDGGLPLLDLEKLEALDNMYKKHYVNH